MSSKTTHPPHTLHLEMVSGIAGDMLLASLLSLTQHSPFQDPILKNLESVRKWLIDQLSDLLPSEKIALEVKSVRPGGIQSTQIDFHTPEDDWDTSQKPDRHIHDHFHIQRNFTDIEVLINQSSLSKRVKKYSLNTFEVLARAEGSIHNVDYRKVHFHEVGSLDAILEVCGFFLLLEKWNISEIIATPLVIGSGTVRCAHGLMPVPVPAVLNMISSYQIPFKKLNWDTGELTTPTGLAILIGSGCQFESSSDKLSIPPIAIGYGAGHKEIPRLVNFVRSSLYPISPTLKKLSIHEKIIEIKVNLDDMSGEEIALLVDEVFSAGALDVCQYPVYMKKGRPGVVLEILCDEESRSSIGECLFKKSSTLGYRYSQWQREILSRKQITLEAHGLSFSAKEITLQDGSHRIKIEDDSLRLGLKQLSLSRRELVEKLNSVYRQQYSQKKDE